MLDTVGKPSVRITLLNSGLSPPIFILASFTDPPWEPQEMKYAGVKMVDSGPYSVDSTLIQVDYMFWRPFNICPGVWNYKYRIGLNDWTICDHNAETETSSSGEAYNVLRVEATGPPFFQSPAALPILGNETSSAQGSRQKSSSDSDSWQSTREDPLEPLDSQQSSASCPSFVTNPFSLSRANVEGEGSDT